MSQRGLAQPTPMDLHIPSMSKNKDFRYYDRARITCA